MVQKAWSLSLLHLETLSLVDSASYLLSYGPLLLSILTLQSLLRLRLLSQGFEALTPSTLNDVADVLDRQKLLQYNFQRLLSARFR